MPFSNCATLVQAQGSYSRTPFVARYRTGESSVVGYRLQRPMDPFNPRVLQGRHLVADHLDFNPLLLGGDHRPMPWPHRDVRYPREDYPREDCPREDCPQEGRVRIEEVHLTYTEKVAALEPDFRRRQEVKRRCQVNCRHKKEKEGEEEVAVGLRAHVQAQFLVMHLSRNKRRR